MSSPTPGNGNSKKQKKPKKRAKFESEQLNHFDSLPWNPSLPEKEDALSFFIGSNELEGGFLSLEEIDESAYGFEIPKPEKGSEEKIVEGTSKSKKRKTSEYSSAVEDESQKVEELEQEDLDQDIEVKQKKKKPKKKKNKKNKKENLEKETAENVEPVADDKEDVEVEAVDETDFCAWNELRLHPVVMKSIYRLKFKEPTPIQKACIPAAAHQGKDVVGAAETGSGKTLAFGLPIIQRLLEERDKVEKQIELHDEADERISAKGFLRALIITPTRELAMQVTDHLKQVTRDMNIRVVPIVGGMSTEKQERLLKSRPEIVVGTPGRLWELMSGGAIHLTELHSLSFFVLDEADRMIESGHFRELQSIIEMLPVTSESVDSESQNTEHCATVSSVQRKKRQTFVFSATIALSADFRKKLKRGLIKSKQSDGLNSIEKLSERAGMRPNAAIVDLTNASILAHKLEESFIECKEEDKDAYLYYILSIHGQGRTIIFCTSIAALRHMSSLLRILEINVCTLHAQMQQRARLKAIDRFRANEHGVLVATDVAARGLDIPGIRTVIHYQLPHSAEVYVHRSGRTARASSDGCSIALIAPNETSKFAGLCKSFAKESFQRFPTDTSYMPEVMKRLSLARQIDKILRKDSQDKAKQSWFEKNAESVELLLDENDSEDERVNKHKKKKASSAQLKKLQEELNGHLSRPLQPKTFSNRYLAGAGVSPLLQKQFEELTKPKLGGVNNMAPNKRRKLVVIGQDCVEPLQALRSAGQEAVQNLKKITETRKRMENLRRKRKEEKKRLHEQRRKQRKKQKAGNQ
ncbi:OLC1v1019492C1 [Oldenlandia corymbosa var. corymbosa]|uniref:ATP-dependent RNA helicase n=1 Tax=Oldenlandia corymbosa var. corymbosa TaxID=529605 RepID=A0AAV1EE65_OLDCO|nr:OLC1v1019492C1 [Oldenlandia corymbosa var. corymbosa]